MLDPMVRNKLDRMPDYKLKSLEDNLRLNGQMMKADEVSKMYTQKQLQRGAALEAERDALENSGQSVPANNSVTSGQSNLETELERLQTGEITITELSKEALVAAYENNRISETEFASEFAQRD